MNARLIVTPDAETDLAEAKAWYDDKRPGLGDEFLTCVDATLDLILRMPLAVPEVLPGVRRATVRRFPFGIFSRPGKDRLVVLAVYHASRDPGGWQSRA